MSERDPIQAVASAIAQHLYGDEEVWRAAAIAAMREVKAQLEADASESAFPGDNYALYCGSEHIGDWLEDK